jgi:hypothetical protein
MKGLVYAVALSFLALVICSPALAQNVKPSPELKKYEPIIGKWVYEDEQRESPSEPWSKAQMEQEVSWMPGGFFVQIDGKGTAFGNEATWIEIVGFDPNAETFVSFFVTSAGDRGGVTSGGWSGSTFTCNWTTFQADGKSIIGRCTWKHPSDYTTVEGICDRFTDGEWWNFRKVKGKKIK